ncbi:NADPH-dependent FMN reductase [Tumebacillus permanentifrigoris]|uniref:NAD(P)H-dependent FMN reductase n=1 Tax=Tumebacillus permanentifrigoris TaxID=378543 RepID=A0A316DBV1_9BACL|nr:NADPH-dependent FMN reductase [Tumebacillus permanentifrigoris]PWK14386.1 NAD(P)H-dependent FMN reductase [Tumebacillus permanentifrigoris]
MKLVALVGSLQKESKSTKGLRVAAEAARQAGAEVIEWSLREQPLPIYDPESEKSGENVEAFIKAMSEADGFLIASPEYHNGPSGVLKNALDFVGYNQFAGKPVGLVAAAGGPIATNTLGQLATILRSLHGYVIPQQGSIGYGDAFNEDGSFQNPKMQERFEKIGTDVVALVKGLRG